MNNDIKVGTWCWLTAFTGEIGQAYNGKVVDVVGAEMWRTAKTGLRHFGYLVDAQWLRKLYPEHRSSVGFSAERKNLIPFSDPPRATDDGKRKEEHV